mmetsp:Transcript_40680/g.73086  ORF Transcript_40680/g.73086 Transcript_40680/m.73086 type:complete len:212 (-) Transcript_40680:85-720(-)
MGATDSEAASGSGAVAVVAVTRGLVQRFSHAAAVILCGPSVHHKLHVTRCQTSRRLRPVRHHEHLRRSRGVAQRGCRSDGVKVARDGLFHVQVPRRTVVQLALHHFTPIGIRPKSVSTVNITRPPRHDLLPNVLIDRNGTDGPFALNHAAVGPHAVRGGGPIGVNLARLAEQRPHDELCLQRGRGDGPFTGGAEDVGAGGLPVILHLFANA